MTVSELESDQTEVQIPRWDNESLKIVCGVANAGGGRVLITTDKNDYTYGFRKLRRPFEQIPEIILKELGIVCTTAPVMSGSHIYLEIDVPDSPEPVNYADQYWVYTKNGNIITSRDDIVMTREEQESGSWELRSLSYVEEKDINIEMLLKISSIPLSSFKNEGEATPDTIEERLRVLHLVNHRTQELVNAGALILCSNPRLFVPGASIRIALFDSDGTQTDKHDEVIGPISKQIDEAVRLIMNEYLPAISTSRSFLRRTPPEESIREAVTNALLHKDYSGGVPIRIRLYPETICIENLGRPPEGWTVEDLLTNHPPKPRNPILAATCRLMGLASGWGGGIDKMIQGCKEKGAEPPTIEITGEETLVTFPLPSSKRGVAAVRRRQTKKDASPDSSPSSSYKAEFSHTSSGAQVGRKQKSNRFVDRSIAAANKLDMTSTDEYVLQVLATNGRLTAPRIAEVLGVSESTVRRSFRRLREYGFIERIGSDKSGYWSVDI